jgi:hypothetical protein
LEKNLHYFIVAVGVLFFGLFGLIQMLCYQLQIGYYTSRPSVLGNISMLMLYAAIFLYIISLLKHLRKNILNQKKYNIIGNASFVLFSIAVLIVIISMIFEIPLDVSN